MLQLKNWRPITLSNCDHKLITRVYNNRILRAIGHHVTPTQTAYIKGRNIADNLRLLGSAVKLSEYEADVDATVIALDAQKAFDSVQHYYLQQVLDRVGLRKFNPILKLLYKNLTNDILINGTIGSGFTLGNGVKQGDALSCSLFLLAMEPVLCNIENNVAITAIASPALNFTWPKVLGYADDLTVLTQNTNDCVNEIFYEYQRFTSASGLHLNADKTEKFNISGVLRDATVHHNLVMYNGAAYAIEKQDKIKINGIYFDCNVHCMAHHNYVHMTEKMERHFIEWSKRSLSLLGKIQIIKTFGISQYLYSLAVIELSDKQWVEVNKLIYKFLWNKDFYARPAPHRLKKSIVTTPRELGGFGMVELKDVVLASQLRRFVTLRVAKDHPIEVLQGLLGGYDYLRPTPKIDIDVVTTSVLKILTENVSHQQLHMLPGMLESDLTFHRQILHCKLRWIVSPNMTRSIEYNMLRARGRHKVGEVLPNAGEVAVLQRIVLPNVRPILAMLAAEYSGIPIPDEEEITRIYDADRATWLTPSIVSSSNIHRFLNRKSCITQFKVGEIEEMDALPLLGKINKLVSIQNRTKLLRLLHGDVYCGTRLVKMGLSNLATCVRCFADETILHLLMECPYSLMVWDIYGINPTDILHILDSDMSIAEFEIRAELINSLVFRKGILPPEVLVKTTMQAFANKLCRRRATVLFATQALSRL